MRIVFMGTPDFAVGTLRALAEAGHEVVLAVTQPDKPKGRGKALQFPAVKEAALELGIPVFQPERVRKPENVEHIRQFNPDIIVVVAFGQLLPKELLEIPKYGCINVHASLLPKYRGAAPIQWAVIDGEEKTGVTIMRMDEGLDTGDIIAVQELALDPDETGGSLFDRLMGLGAALCVKTLSMIEQGTAVYTPQDHDQATKTGLITKQMGEINWNLPAVRIERFIRGLNPWPSAFTHLQGKQLKIWKAQCLPDENEGRQKPGTVLKSPKGTLMIQTGDGILDVLELQLEGKKRMDADSFLRGCRIEPQTVVGEK